MPYAFEKDFLTVVTLHIQPKQEICSNLSSVSNLNLTSHKAMSPLTSQLCLSRAQASQFWPPLPRDSQFWPPHLLASRCCTKYLLGNYNQYLYQPCLVSMWCYHRDRLCNTMFLLEDSPLFNNLNRSRWFNQFRARGSLVRPSLVRIQKWHQ